MYVTVGGGEMFTFASLWDTWRNPAGETVNSCTIITTAPNELMKAIHDRMPVILPKEAHAAWLSPRERRPEELLPLMRPYPAAEMSARAVSRLVNSSKNEGPELLEAA